MTVCSTCNDTHAMTLHRESGDEQVVLCTRCPVPCARCRRGGTGPYCETTPCACACHEALQPGATCSHCGLPLAKPLLVSVKGALLHEECGFCCGTECRHVEARIARLATPFPHRCQWAACALCNPLGES